MKYILALIAVFAFYLPTAQAENEPFNDVITVVKTADGRIILSSISPLDKCTKEANSYIATLPPATEFESYSGERTDEYLRAMRECLVDIQNKKGE